MFVIMIPFPNISVLLSHEANVNAEDYRGYTPLFYAADNLCFGNLIELLDTGRVEVNHEAKNAKTALSKADNYETLMILRKHGAEINGNQLDKLIKSHTTFFEKMPSNVLDFTDNATWCMAMSVALRLHIM